MTAVSQWARALLVMLAALLVAVAPPPVVAGAHVEVVATSDPTRDAVVRSTDVIMVEFTGPIRTTAATFTLRSSDGTDHALAPPEYDADDTVVRLRPADGGALPDGLYRAGFQISFTDGHPAVGVIQFEVSGSGEARAAPWPADDPAPARAEPERFDVSGQLPWLIGGGAVLVVGFGWFLRRAARSQRAPRDGGHSTVSR